MFRPALLCTLVIVAVSGSARGANRRSFLFGPEAVTTGAALTARSRGTEALFYNPAGLGGQVTNRLDLSLTALNVRFENVGDGLVVQFPDGEESTDVSASEFLPTPSALVFARRASEQLGWAFGVYVTNNSDRRFDSRISRDGIDVPDLDEPVDSRSGVTSQDQEKTYLIGGGVGWEFHPRLRLGGGLFLFYNRTVSSFQLFSTAATESGDSEAFFLAAESSDVKVVGLAPTVSLQWQPIDPLYVAAILRPPAFSIFTWGERAPLASSPGQGDQLLTSEREEISDFTFEPLTPLSGELMVVFENPTYALGATFELVAPINDEGILLIDTTFQWNLRVGGQYTFSDALSAGIGFYTDRGIDRDLPTQPASGLDYYGTTAGLTLHREFGDKTRVGFNTTLSVGYAAGVGDVDAIVISGLGGLDDISTRPQRVLFHEFTLNFASGFEF